MPKKTKKILTAILLAVLVVDLIPYNKARAQESPLNGYGGVYNVYVPDPNPPQNTGLPGPGNISNNRVPPSASTPDVASLVQNFSSPVLQVLSTSTWQAPLNNNVEATPQNTEIFEYTDNDSYNDGAGRFLCLGSIYNCYPIDHYAVQSYISGGYTNLSTAGRTIQSQLITSSTVSVIVTPTGVSQNTYEYLWTRYGVVTGTAAGDQTAAAKQCPIDITVYECDGYPFPVKDAVYENGTTYYIYWTTPLNWTVESLYGNGDNPDPIYDEFVASLLSPDAHSPSAQLVSQQPVSLPAAAVTRDLNSDIVFLTQPYCWKKSWKTWFKSKASVECTDYGLSADGRLGYAYYHKTKSSFGGFFGSFVIALPISILLPVVGSIFDFGFIGNQVAGTITQQIAESLLSNPILQAASGPGAYGTVETSNNLGVGNWDWIGGFLTSVPISIFTPSTSTVTISANPTSIILNQSSTLVWSSANVTACAASNAWSGPKALTGSEIVTPMTTGELTYTLTCSISGGSSATNSTTVTVIPPQPTLSCGFSSSPVAIIPPATSALSWNCQNANSCSINQGIGSVNSQFGSINVQPSTSTTYTLTCQGLGNSKSYDAQVNVFTPKLKEIPPR